MGRHKKIMEKYLVYQSDDDENIAMKGSGEDGRLECEQYCAHSNQIMKEAGESTRFIVGKVG